METRMPDQEFHKSDDAFRAGEALSQETAMRAEVERLATQGPVVVPTQMMQDAMKTHELFTTYLAAGFTRPEALYLTGVSLTGGPAIVPPEAT
jgi:hypothetical protein